MKKKEKRFEKKKNSVIKTENNKIDKNTDVYNFIKNDENEMNLFPSENNNEPIQEDSHPELSEKEIEKLYKEKKIQNLSLFNIILKAIFANIGKITLLTMYFAAVSSINIIHFILVIVFVIQLLFPQSMIKQSLLMLILCQLVFMIEYIADLFKSSTYSDSTVKLLRLLIPFDKEQKQTSIEYLLYIISYCYYTQYQLYNYEFYQKLAEDKNMSLSVYIEKTLKQYPIIKKILIVIGKIILELYIWTLISIFIFFDSYFEISVLFAFKLFIFFIIVYKFLRVIQSNKPTHLNRVLNWFFLIFCALNTVSIYCYQFLCLEFFPFNDMIEKSDNFFIKNLPAFGLYRYKEKHLLLKRNVISFT